MAYAVPLMRALMRSVALFTLTLPLLAMHGCSDGRSSSGGGANSSTGGAGGGTGGAASGSECLGKTCGEPCHDCAACDPLSQQICDDFDTCQATLDITCAV